MTKKKPPILFLIYKRPDLTKRIFQVIAAFKPTHLFIAADGPKNQIEEEECRKTREIIKKINWQCKVQTLFREKNLGCKTAISSAISWFFDNVNEGIILEDDCLPHPSFFRFCQELLDKYRNDTRIFHISGNNFQKTNTTKFSYYFSKYPHNWGWATWKKAWNLYDVKMKSWPKAKALHLLQDILNDPRAIKYWTNIFDKVYSNEADTWDYQWTFSCWIQNGLSILPNKNLVRNIGFTKDATHTTKDPQIQQAVKEILFPLKHPPYCIPDLLADTYTQKEIFKTSSLYNKLHSYIKLPFQNHG